MERVLTALGILMVLILILYLSYVFTRYIGKRAGRSGFGGGSGKNMGIVEQKMLSQEASVALLQVGQRIFLVGITKQNISLLSEIEDEALVQDLSLKEEGEYGQPFKEIFRQLKDRKIGSDK